MKKNKFKLQFSPAKKKKTITRIAAIAIILVALIFGIGYAWKKLKNSDIFRVKDIMVSEGSPEIFLYLKNRNILDIDIRKESRYLSEYYPNYRNIRISRFLPSALRIDFIKRNPVGIIKLNRFFYVDVNQVLFDISSLQPIPEIPVITGLENKIPGPKSGVKYGLGELELALLMIKELKRIPALRAYKVKSIDVCSLANATLFLQVPQQYQNSGKSHVSSEPAIIIEVKIGQEDIGERIKILRVLLADIKYQASNIQYIDLRFKEPTVRFKDAK